MVRDQYLQFQELHNRKSKKMTRQFCAELLFYGTNR